MKTYELSYIISPEVTSEEAENFAKELESFVQSKEGTVVKQTNPVAKTLAYQIKKHASGFIGAIEFQLDPEKLVELKEKMEKDGKVNRHMLIIKNPLKPEKKRRSRNKTEDVTEVAEKGVVKEITIESKKVAEEKPAVEEKEEVAKEEVKTDKKVELKDIEQKLEEILGE